MFKKSLQVACMIGFENLIDPSDIWVDDNMLYPGYGQLNPLLLEAIDLLAQCEGILLDPTYTGKAMAGMIDLIERKHFSQGQNVIFLHTGGAPALFGYPEILDQHS